MKLASVILDIPTQALDAPYTYAVPEEAGDQPIEVGCAVLVPFGPRQAVGFVIGVLQDSCETALNSSSDALFTIAACKRAERLGIKMN